jgi:hypothetical protein
MGTHAQLGVKFPDGQILGCYVHYDGHTLRPRIQDYLAMHTMTNLVLLIVQAQQAGGLRSFHCPPLSLLLGRDFTPVTQFLDDNKPHVIDEDTWGNGGLAEAYFWLVDYETGEFLTTTTTA